jgi:DNA-binding transcriptional regulator GbsR (MarR family)
MDESSVDSTLARQPVTVAEISTEKPSDGPTISVSSETEIPPSLKQEMKQKPYFADIFELGDAYHHFDMESHTHEIDSFINSEIKRKELDDTKANYKKVLDELYRNVKPTDNVYTNTEKLLEFIRIQRKLLEVIKEKEEFEKKPLELMNSKELKRYIDGKR